ncbi:MAG: DUF4013 domain-containing protein [Methanobacterium sp.]|nr:DUF4013 domain-containing protein [Methanobacterium sp.]
MDAGQITSDALKYPARNFSKILILGVLTVLSSLLIPGFLVLGYFYKIVKFSLAGSSELPDFNEWTSMFVDGLKVFVVLFLYSLVPTVLVLLGVWAALLPMLTVPDAGSLLDPTLALQLVSGIALIGVLLQIVVSFVIPIALANMVYKDELKAAFRFGEIYNIIRRIGGVDYLIWYIIMLIIVWVVYFISSFLIFPFLIGIIIVPIIIMPYLTIFFARSVALLFNSQESGHEYYRHSKQVK